jgi:hypothetical protein
LVIPVKADYISRNNPEKALTLGENDFMVDVIGFSSAWEWRVFVMAIRTGHSPVPTRFSMTKDGA